jgi:hypothetical protein
LVAAYNADIAHLSHVALACLTTVVPYREPADLALDYVAVAWKGAPLSQAGLAQALEARYGATMGAEVLNSWSPGSVNWSCGSMN